MQRVRSRLLQDRREEVEARAQLIYSGRKEAGRQGQVDGFADWLEAEGQVIRATFERQAGCTASLLDSLQVRCVLLHTSRCAAAAALACTSICSTLYVEDKQ